MRAATLLILALCVAAFAVAPRPATALDICPLCVQFTEQSIGQLLNIILNAGVIGGCGELCSFLPAKLEQTACNLVCDVAGIDLFIHAIEKADLNPIYFCELVKVCPVHDCTGTCAKIVDTSVSPPSGRQGTTFNIAFAYQVYNQTSTGTIEFGINPPDGEAFGDSELVPKGFQPGTFQGRVSLETQPTEDESFSPGTYQVEIALCEGICGDTKPHSSVLAVAQTSFKIQ